MAIDKVKLQEDEVRAVTRFYKIILGWDYKQVRKENQVLHKNSSFFFPLFLNLCDSESEIC